MKNWIKIEEEQKEVCKRLEVDWVPVEKESMVAINESLFSDLQPINGFRHPREGTIEGWYLWSGGEIPQNDDNFFKPIHAEHLNEERQNVLRYMGLPPGWRFQIDDNGYEDIWFDGSILEI